MGTINTALLYLFLMSLLLVALAYYTGLVSDAGAVKDALVGILYAATGRNSSGQFQAYPSHG